jgi:probable rRNA maturation factor
MTLRWPIAPHLHLLIHDERWLKENILNEDEVLRALAKATEILSKDFSPHDITIALSNDAEVHSLNKAFRNKDTSTNVLSFPSDEGESLGDIILAFETIIKEAETTKISPLHHTLHLIIHGFLHLLGYDHEKDDDALQMEGLEVQILESLSIANPYEET